MKTYSHQHELVWTRRRFLQAAGQGICVALTLELQGSAWVRAAQPCAYGSGNYGIGLYSGTFPPHQPLILLDRSESDVVLSWEAGPAGILYEVWRSDQPFEPGDPGSALVTVSGGVGAIDSGAADLPGDLYYVVRGVPVCSDP